jgi:holo-[acyl-carrier protein] synthase
MNEVASIKRWMRRYSGPLQKSNPREISIWAFPFIENHISLTIMLIGTGIDVVEIERIARSIERYGGRFLERIYTDSEIAYCHRRKNCAESFAARFAAKEAAAKAIGTGIQHGLTWTELEVRRAPGQRPAMHFSGRALDIAEKLGVKRVSLSLTHGKSVAIATVMLEDH